MYYIRVEDSKDGFELCRYIAEIYGKEDEIDIKSFNGIGNIEQEIESLDARITELDHVLIVYDDIHNNPIIMRHLVNAVRVIKEAKHRKQYGLIKTISFELETLMIQDIEYFMKVQVYNSLVSQIRELFRHGHDVSALTEYTKNCSIYDAYYDKIRNRKRNQWEYKRLCDEEFEQCITIESLSKELLKEVFREHDIDRPLTDCWKRFCCYRKRRCCLKYIDTYKIEEMQSCDVNAKMNILISNTSYRKIVKALGKEVIYYKVSEFFNDAVFEAAYIRNRVREITQSESRNK